MVTFDSTDLDNAVSESGVVHESVTNTDHNDASELKQGYKIKDPYLSADLVGYWPLQEDAGSTAYDFSGNNNDGTISGATVNQTGLLGTSAYSFDGDDQIELPLIFGGSTPTAATMTLWAYVGSSATKSVAMEFRTDDGYWGIDYNDGGNNKFRAFVYDSTGQHGAISTTTVQENNWYFVSALLKNDDSIEIYVNGVSEAVEAINSIFTDSYTNTIGSAGNDADYWNGKISNPQIYNRVLTESEIENLYNVVTTPGTLTTQSKAI